MAERTDFLYPFIEGDEHDATTLLVDLGASARGEGRGQRRAAGHHPDRQRGDAGRRRRRDGSVVRVGRVPVHLRQRWELDRRRLARVAVHPPAVGRRAAGALPRGGHGRRHRARQRRRLRPRLLPPADRSRRGPATSPSASRRAGARATCSSAFAEARRRGLAPSAWPGTTAARWRPRPTSSTASWSAPRASTASRSRRPRSASPSGKRCRSAAVVAR